ncbi:MAG: TonB family protein [Planctomycetota bacterium]|nr:MAG: TonB family protein [Planctomycetota bacterium]
MLAARPMLCLAPLLVACAAAAGAQDVGQSLRDLALAGQAQAVRDLLAGAAPDLDAADGTGRTALMYAVEGGHDEIVGMLLAAGAGVNRQDQSGQTALHLSARHGRTVAARLLLGAGADFGLRDADGRTPLYRAIERRRADVIEMLQAAAVAKGKGPMSQAPLGSPEHQLPPTIVESTTAPYTESALASKIEGTVVLMVLVRRDGSVGAASVSKGLEATLDESALRTVKEWKFSPAMRGGKTVEVVLEVEVSFRLPAEL